MPVGGLVEVEVQAAGAFLAGRFRAVFALGRAGLALADVAAMGIVPVGIELSLDGLGYVEMLTGRVENIRVDLATNNVMLSGRDLTALLIDAELAESFVNQTASEVAQTIALRHGLAPNVAQTFLPVGQYYQIDHARTALNVGSRATTEWNLLCRLAEAEGYAVSVTSGVLNFGPVGVAAERLVTPRSFASLEVDVVTALPDAVVVRSWNSRSKQVVTQGGGGGAVTNIVRPNMNVTQAGNYAASYLAMVQRHGKVLLGRMPGDTSLAVGDALVLAGTNSALDDGYVVTSLLRRLNGRDGFVQMVKAYAVD